MTDISLMDYQLRPVQRLLSECQGQRGMLVWHAMGTGKSATGLAFIKSLKKLNCLLCVPQVLVDVWIGEGDKFGVDLSSSIQNGSVTLVTFEKTGDRADLLKYLENVDARSLKETAFVCDEAHNIISILNSLDTKAAARLYRKLFSFKKILLLTGTPMYREEKEFRVLVNIAAGSLVIPNDPVLFEQQYFKTSIWKSALFGWTLSFLSKFLYQTRDAASAAINYDIITHGTDSASNQLYTDLVSFLQKFLVNVTLSTLVAVSIPFFVPILLASLLRIATKSQNSSIRVMDAAKVAKVVAPYVSFYEIPKTAVQDDYPEVKVQRNNIDYNANQIDMWIRFAWGTLTPRELVRLEVYSSVSEAALFGSITQLDIYKANGRAIGNLHYGDLQSPKFLAIHKLITADNAVQQTVIYSAFDQAGVQLFHRFCLKNGIRSTVLRPSQSPVTKARIQKRFANKLIQVLILDSSFTEGISLFGARQMHILEPVDNPSKLQQIVARVSRFRSHQHLPPAQRIVNVYVWTATANNLNSRLLKFGRSQAAWAKNQSHIGPWAAESLFETNLTPDGLIQTRNDVLAANTNALSKEITRYNVKHNSQKAIKRCRVAFDVSDQTVPECNRFGGA